MGGHPSCSGDTFIYFCIRVLARSLTAVKKKKKRDVAPAGFFMDVARIG